MDEKERIPWRGDGLKNISEFRSEFLQVQPNLLVEVQLVGFDGGDAGITVGTDEMYRALGALQKDIESVVLQPEFKRLVSRRPCVSMRMPVSMRGPTSPSAVALLTHSPACTCTVAGDQTPNQFHGHEGNQGAVCRCQCRPPERRHGRAG
jgi:hypothetical protein